MELKPGDNRGRYQLQLLSPIVKGGMGEVCSEQVELPD